MPRSRVTRVGCRFRDFTQYDWASEMTGDDSGLGPLRFAGAGLELAGSFLIFAAIGYWIDQYGQWERPWGMLVGGLLGFIAGMVRLIRLANQSNR